MRFWYRNYSIRISEYIKCQTSFELLVQSQVYLRLIYLKKKYANKKNIILLVFLVSSLDVSENLIVSIKLGLSSLNITIESRKCKSIPVTVKKWKYKNAPENRRTKTENGIWE